MNSGATRQTYYQLLGVAENASEQAIRTAFRSLLKKWHPDVCKDPLALEMTIKLNEAWEVLKDPTSRAEYDRYLRAARSPSASSTSTEWEQTTTRARSAHRAEENASKDLDELLRGLGAVAVAATQVGLEAGGCLLRFYWGIFAGLLQMVFGVVILGLIVYGVSCMIGGNSAKSIQSRSSGGGTSLLSDEKRARLLAADPHEDLGNGYTSLHLAVGKHDKALVEAIIAKGADVNAQTEDGATPIMLAAALEDFEACQALLNSKEIDLNKQDKGGTTALYLAVEPGNKSIVKALLDHKADPNIEDSDGFTPLDMAAEKDWDGIAELLVSGGAKVSHRSHHGLTALDIAVAKRSIKVEDFLRSKK